MVSLQFGVPYAILSIIVQLSTLWLDADRRILTTDWYLSEMWAKSAGIILASRVFTPPVGVSTANSERNKASFQANSSRWRSENLSDLADPIEKEEAWTSASIKSPRRTPKCKRCDEG